MRLVLVPTPIGNLEDITLRALRVLREAGVVAAEDTRRTRRLLEHYGIETPLVRLDQHTVSRLAGLFETWETVAYVTDAGTPGVSDPGAELVGEALRLGAAVEVLPGPTALIPALVASGFPTARFSFEGFLPKKGGLRRQRLEQLVLEGRTAVLYESPHRLSKTLRELAEVYGEDHPVAVARELTKVHEEVFRGTIGEAMARFTRPKGEVVLVLAPAEAPSPDETALLESFVGQGLSGKALVEALVEAGLARNRAYQLAVEVERRSQ